jgi:hypothetical protein
MRYATLAALLLSGTAAAAAVTFESLLGEMVDRDRLARLPEPAYTCRQFSSYDRAAVSRDEPASWFANKDFSQFVRTGELDGKPQHVLMDAEGPGAIVRFWATWSKRPENVVRIFLDGAAEPAVVAPLARLVDGGELAGPPLSQGVSPATEYDRRGHNLYLPIPYARRCTVVCEGPVEGPLYYQINYRTYAPGTEVRSFHLADLDQSRTLLARVQHRLLRPGPACPDDPVSEFAGPLPPGEARSVRIRGPAAIRELTVRLAADDIEQALRSTVLAIAFDGEDAVWCPVGDFFGTGHQLHEAATWYTSVGADGSLGAHWVMPFRNEARVQVLNVGTQQVELVLGDVRHGPWRWDDRSMHFHATWRELRRKEAGKHEDVNFVGVRGAGVYVGDSLTLFNGSDKWWGEGDEKVYVDGETFPSHFGTGTEDYYGYAWGRKEFFAAPFHAQPSGGGNSAPGMTVNVRHRALDTIPFAKSLAFDMELWHWAQTRVNYAPATFWYARPGAVANVKPDPGAAAQPVARAGEDVAPVHRIEGAIEGEALEVAAMTGGTNEVQTSQAWGWSGNAQRWWKDGKAGDRLEVAFAVPEPGPRRVVAHINKAKDYGVHRFEINGRPAGEADCYNPEVRAEPIDLGVHELSAGRNLLAVVIAGANEKAEKRHMFGLDCLELKEP